MANKGDRTSAALFAVRTSSNQGQSRAINGNQGQSMAIKGDRTSAALFAVRTSSRYYTIVQDVLQDAGLTTNKD